MAKITYSNKETLNAQPSIADKNKVTSDDMNEIKSVVNTNYGEVGDINNLNTTDKTSIVNAINSMQGAILWVNPNPSSNFSAKNITLSSGNYDILEIFYSNAPGTNYIYSSRIYKGKSTFLTVNHISGSNTVFHRWRAFDYSNDTTYSISTGTQQGTNSASSDNSISYIIPLYVIGYNTGLFS